MSTVSAPTRPGAVLAVLITAQLMIGLDSSIVTIALPSIRADLHLGLIEQSWIQNAYTLTFGGLLLLGGRIGDLVGRRRVLVTGVLTFTVASLVAGLAPNGPLLIAARALQGIGAALIAPSTLALLMVNFPAGPGRDRALSVYSSMLGAGASLGLLLGGILTSIASWPWVFLVNIPIGVVAALAAPRFIAQPERHPARLDVAGAFTSTLGMVALVMGLVGVASSGWLDPSVLGAFGLAVVLIVVFVLLQRRTAAPLVPLHLFADRVRALDYTTVLLMAAAMFGVFYLLTLFLQLVWGLGPLLAGLAFLPMTLSMFLSVRRMPRLLKRFGPGPLIVIGTALATLGLLWLSRVGSDGSYAAQVLGPIVVFSVGAGCTFMPLNSAILARVAPAESGAASGVLQTLQWVGGSLGLAALVTVFGSVTGGARAGEALTAGLDAGFLGAAALAAAALVVALVRRGVAARA